MNVSEPRISYKDFQLQFPRKSQQINPDFFPFNKNNAIGDDNEKISAFAACKSYIACGTFSGRIFIYTYEDEQPKTEFKMQNFRITGLSFNNNCTLLLASSFDSKISFIDLNDNKISFSYSHNAKILDCSIDPESRIGGPYSCVFIDNGVKGEQNNNKVIRLKPPNKFFNKKEIAEEISGNESGLEKIVWQGDIIAWSSLKHFTVMNIKSGQKVTSPQRSSYLDSTSRTSFLFTPNNESLTVFFKGNLYEVTLLPKIVIQQPKSSPKKNVIIMTRTADFDARLIQQVERNAEPKIEFQTPRECYDDFVPYDSFDPNEFLELTPGARDIILALPYKVIGITRAKLSEIIDVYLSSNCIEACINKFKDAESSIDSSDRSILFKKIISHLLAKNDIDRCIAFCEFAKPNDWEEIIKCFEAANCLKAIAPQVKLKEAELSKESVTKVLRCLALECNTETFSDKFTSIQPNRYDANALIGDISRQAEKDPDLKRFLIVLQHSTENHQKALQSTLEIKQMSFFGDVETFALFDFVKKNFLKVLQTYPKDLPDFLMRHLTELPPAKLLKKANKFLNQANKDRDTNLIKLIENFKLDYLDKLYHNKDPIINNEEFGTELASLYIRSKDEEKAMEFLQGTTNYRLMGICKEAENNKMYQVAAFLYFTAGNKKKGMEIHLSQIKDPQKSLEYAKMCEDKDVWKMISEHAYKHKDYLECMLADLPNLNIKMKEFISKIPPDMHIENFEDLAKRSLNEYQRKLRTAQLAYEIVSKDAFGAFKRSFNSYKNGVKTNF